MDYQAIERKWQARWEKAKINQFDKKSERRKWYVLEMFSYPSGAKLHIGHWYNYGPTDTYARFKRMQGYNVFQPMGFDAFGLPAENYAIKTGIHPKDSTEKNIETMEGQLRAMGAMFDWSAEVKTCEENYYKWTQWMFLQLYKKGLAYRKEAPVNWCPSCQTVLANEQAEGGVCERCGSQVVRKNLTQWFFKITDYAEELLSGLDALDWPEKTKNMQRNWIGKSTGCEIEFECESGDKLRVYTTRCDTVFGVTYVVLAPEHPLARKLTTPEQLPAVEEYIAQTAKANEIERLSSTREKTGVFTGSYCTNPVNGKKIPIWLADYVLASYGTGAVMAVPAHDERDYAFATKYNLPIVKVIEKKGGETQLPFTEDGIMVGSLQFDGLFGEEARAEVAAYISKLGKGGKKVNYRLRDWLVSRQRYWGAPIPVIHCPNCGAGSPRSPSAKNSCTPSAPSAAARRSATPTRWTPLCVRAGTTCAMRTRTTKKSPSPARQPMPCCPWTCTWAARNTPACTCCMRGSLRRRCAIWAISTSPNRSRGLYIRASFSVLTATA